MSFHINAEPKAGQTVGSLCLEFKSRLPASISCIAVSWPMPELYGNLVMTPNSGQIP